MWIAAYVNIREHICQTASLEMYIAEQVLLTLKI